MTSAINPLYPVTGSPTTQSVRDNFTASKSEIEALQASIGWADYNDLTTATTLISPAINTFTKLTNDGAGAFTNTSHLPAGITSLWNTSTGQANFSQLPLYSMVNARYELFVTTTTANQAVYLSTFLGIGSASAYESPKLYQLFKTAGTYPISVFTGSYIGSTDIKNYPAEIRLKSDAACTVKVNGWYFQVFKKI